MGQCQGTVSGVRRIFLIFNTKYDIFFKVEEFTINAQMPMTPDGSHFYLEGTNGYR